MSDAATSLLLLLGLLEKGDNGNGGGPSPGPAPAPQPTPVYPPTPGPSPGPGPFPPPAPHPIPPPGVLPGPFPPIPPIKPQPWPGPSPTPSSLPPFPGPGWVPDTPVSQAVSLRAAYWNPQLWNFATQTIVKPFVQEQFGGRWLTFKAAQHGTMGNNKVMATEAWRLATAPPAPGPTPPGPAPGPQPTPEHPGVNYSYTGQPQDAATIAEWGSKLTSVDAYDINNAWIVRMWEWAAGLTQAGYPGVDSVTPSGTDGRYGHDAHQALLDHGFPNAQPVAAARPAWWGKSGTYTNPGEPPPPSGAIPPEAPVSAMARGKAPAPHMMPIHMKV